MILDTIKNSVILCEDIYAYPGASIITWDYLSQGKVYWGLKRANNENYICFRGSTTLQDWLRDFNAVANPFIHDKLGPIHPGFWDGMSQAWTEIKSKVTSNIVFTGHSLGSGEVDVASGLAILDNINPIAKIGFGSPKAGFKQLGQMLKNIPDFCFRNTNGILWDLITSMPFTFYPEEYQHTAPLFNVCAAPPAYDEWGVFSWHHIQLYKQAILNLTEARMNAHSNITIKMKDAYYNASKPE